MSQRSDGEKESLADFVQSYIDLRLNIAEAKAQRVDTTGKLYQRFVRGKSGHVSEVYAGYDLRK